MVSTVRSLVWELMCIRALSLANCSSSWCWVLEVLVRNLCTGVPWELPCALVRINMKKTKFDGLQFLPGCPTQIKQLSLCCLLQGHQQQLHWVLAVQAMGPQEVQHNHWSTSDCPVLHLSQVLRRVSSELKWSGGWSTGTVGWLSASEQGHDLDGWPAMNTKCLVPFPFLPDLILWSTENRSHGSPVLVPPKTQ